MQFHDKRQDPSKPLSERLCRLVGAVILNELEHDAEFVKEAKRNLSGLHVGFYESDPKLGEVEHLQLNFEPTWFTDAFTAAWHSQYGTRIAQVLLENTEWKRYAWAIWEQ